jgi:hypothetical protein
MRRSSVVGVVVLLTGCKGCELNDTSNPCGYGNPSEQVSYGVSSSPGGWYSQGSLTIDGVSSSSASAEVDNCTITLSVYDYDAGLATWEAGAFDAGAFDPWRDVVELALRCGDPRGHALPELGAVASF